MILPPISSNCHHHTITNLILLLTSFHRVTKNSLNLSSEWIIARNKFSLRLCPKLHGNSERFSLDCTCKRMLIWQTRWMRRSYQGVGQIKWYCVTHIVWVILYILYMWIMSHHFDHGARITIKKMMRNVCHLASSCRFIKKQCMLVINNFLMLVTNSFFTYNSVYES